MLSLARTISRLDREEKRYKTALGCYLAAISLFRDVPLEAQPEAVRAYTESLDRLHSESSEAEPEALDKSRESLTTILQTYYSSAAAFASARTEDLRVVISALGEAALLLGRQHQGHADKLKDFTNRLQETSKVMDLALMRRQIVGHVASLRALGDRAREDSDRTLATLRAQLAEFSSRLDCAERRASTDALTSLLNRGEGESRLRQIVRTSRPVSTLLVDLNRFKQINDAWGHSAGDQVLKTSARILADHLGAGEVAIRWGGDEFLLILHCEEGRARERARALKERLRQPQKVVLLGKIFEIPSGASIGVAELQEGESAEDLIARVDGEMYRDKGARTESELHAVLA